MVASRRMFDAIDAAALPEWNGESWYAGYIDGIYPSYHAIRRRFPRARVVSITVLGNEADVLDVEQGNPVMGEGVVTWVRRMRALGRRPVVYTNASSIGGLLALFTVEAPPFWWVAQWNGSPHHYPGAIATQYDHPPTSGGAFDISLVSPNWPDERKHMGTLRPVIDTKKAKQRTGSVARQAGAGTLVGAAMFGITPQVPGVNPTVVWFTQFFGGLAIFLIEHFVGDPTTGTGTAA